MSDLVGNPEDRFSRVAAHFILILSSTVITKLESKVCFVVCDNGFSQIFYNCSNVEEIFSWHNIASSLSQNVQQNFENRLTNKKVPVKNIFE